MTGDDIKAKLRNGLRLQGQPGSTGVHQKRDLTGHQWTIDNTLRKSYAHIFPLILFQSLVTAVVSELAPTGAGEERRLP